MRWDTRSSPQPSQSQGRTTLPSSIGPPSLDGILHTGAAKAYEPCLKGPLTRVCGGPGSVFFEAESMSKHVEWTYVGSQKGEYECAPDYSYVGPGHGAWEKELRTTYFGWQLRKVWIFLILALVLAGTAYACYRFVAWHSSIAPSTATAAAPGRPAASPAVAYNTDTFVDGAAGRASYSYTSTLAPVGPAPAVNTGINSVAPAPSPPWSALR